MTTPCPTCARLRDELAFERDMRKFAQSAAATIADLDEVAPALRHMLRQEKDRRRRAEDEVARLTYRLALTQTAPEEKP